MIKYTLKKGVIKKTGAVAEYEPKAFNEAMNTITKQLKEAEAQKGIYDAKAENVARNHKFVTEMSEEKRNAIWLYHENFVASIQAADSIKKIKKNIKGLKAEMKDITEQTGHKF